MIEMYLNVYTSEYSINCFVMAVISHVADDGISVRR